MIRRMLLAALCAMVVASSSIVSAQEPAAAARLEAMKKLGILEGDWRGEGWQQMGPGGRKPVSVTEAVRFKLDGTIMVIDGRGTTKNEAGEERVVHNAFAVISYDPAANRYDMKAYLADGRSTDATAEWVDGAFQWGFATPQGFRIRYTIRLTDKGEWHEVGEMSQDGTTWRQFFEMTLHRTA